MQSPMIGKVIDNYRILELLGKGGMGIVYKAMDINMEKIVALKMMNPLLAQDEAFLKRFRQEAKALAKSENRHIVNVFALRETEAGLLLVMEYVPGTTLEQWIAQNGAMPYRQALTLIKQLLSAIGHAHRAGVIHRDLKASNVMITAEGEVKVTDFGLARIAHSGSTTRTLSTGGTLYYMSPEQVQELPSVDHRSDIYSLGMTCYEMVAGRTPFDKTQSELDVGNAIVRDKFPPPDHFNPDVPEALSRLVMKSLEKDQLKRFQTAEAMLAEVDRVEKELLLPKPQPAPQPAGFNKLMLTVAAAALVILALAGAYWFFDQPPAPAAMQAAMFISTVPEGATVSLDGEAIGLTPLNEYPVPAGKHRLSFQKQDYASFDTTFVVSEGRPVPIFVALQPLLGQIVIQVTPSTATVWVDGAVMASHELMDLQLAPGSHVVRVAAEGYEIIEKNLRVEQGLNPTQFIALKPSRQPGLPPAVSRPGPPPPQPPRASGTAPPRPPPAVPLRATAAMISETTVKELLKARDFFDNNWNKSGGGIAHQYESVRIRGQNLVVDRATGLVWQQGGSEQGMKLAEAVAHIKQLNNARFAGYSDWRLPTLEEALSLIEPQRRSNDKYIASRFDPKQFWIWTTDAESQRKVWVVDFSLGCCGAAEVTRPSYVRAVRTGNRAE